MSFVASHNQIPSFSIVPNRAFFPEICLNEFLESHEIDGSVSTQRAFHALSVATAEVNAELKGLRNRSEALQIPRLIYVENKEFSAEELALLYKRAVFCRAHAELMARYLNYSSTESAVKNSEAEYQVMNDYLRLSRFAIRDILGKNRITADLI